MQQLSLMLLHVCIYIHPSIYPELDYLTTSFSTTSVSNRELIIRDKFIMKYT